MPSRARYRVEHVATKPRGWKVRTSLSGAHVLRIGYPPGRRRRGAGRLLEVLHPKREASNPRCQMSEWAEQAKANPEELLIFGLNNPAPARRENYISETFRKGSDGAVVWANTEAGPWHVTGYVNDMQTYVGERGGPYKTRERARKQAHKWLEKTASHKSGNPHIQVVHDPAVKKFRAQMYDERLGNLYATGYTKKQAARALLDVWRRERRQRGLDRRPAGNPEKIGEHLGHEMFFEGISYNAPSLKLYGYSTDLALRRAIARKLKAKARPNAKNPAMRDELLRLWHTARIAGASSRHERLTWAAKEWEKNHPGERLRAYKELDRLTRGGYGNPRERRVTHETIEWRGRPMKIKISGTESRGYVGQARLPGHGWLMSPRYGDRARVVDYFRSAKPDIENPRRRGRRRHNPISESEQAVKLFSIFHGEDPSKVTAKHVSAAMRKDYTALGKLVAVGMNDQGYGEREIAQKWDKCSHINFSDDHVTLASSPDGKQLYAIGGNQNLNGCLEKFDGIDPEKDFIDLGEVVFVVYEARKIHDDFEPVEYVHKFGGHGRSRPGWFYDRLKKAIFFIGGEYFIEINAKISPGIEG